MMNEPSFFLPSLFLGYVVRSLLKQTQDLYGTADRNPGIRWFLFEARQVVVKCLLSSMEPAKKIIYPKFMDKYDYKPDLIEGFCNLEELNCIIVYIQ